MLLTRKLYLQDQVRFDSGLWQTAGAETLVLPQGSYEMILHGAGGAGGQSGTTYEDYSGGSGGAGGVGQREIFFVRLTRPTVVGLYVGEKGLTVANGGNGGAKGAWTDSGESGAGGGGGKPTYVKFAATTNSDVQVKTYCAWVAADDTIMYTKPNAELTAGGTVRIYAAGELDSSISFGLLGNVNEEGTGFTFEGNAYSRDSENDVYDVSSVYLYALGGGGGGGGGAPGRISYRTDGGSGGGGGGYYRFTGDVSEPFVSVPGKQGSKGGIYSSSDHTYANSGTTGNTTDFPGVYSGNGARSSTNSSGVNGAYGGGASGAGGREGASAEHSSISSGAGGGGAGGDLDAGGGKAGTSYFSGATAGYNHHTTPTATKDHLGNTQTSGWGVGGGVNANGSDGWLYIKRIS